MSSIYELRPAALGRAFRSGDWGRLEPCPSNNRSGENADGERQHRMHFRLATRRLARADRIYAMIFTGWNPPASAQTPYPNRPSPLVLPFAAPAHRHHKAYHLARIFWVRTCAVDIVIDDNRPGGRLTHDFRPRPPMGSARGRAPAPPATPVRQTNTTHSANPYML